jgi:transposase
MAIAVAVAEWIRKLGPVEDLKVCYEAGSTSCGLYWQLTQLDVASEVIAPALVLTKAGDRVKSDRHDAHRSWHVRFGPAGRYRKLRKWFKIKRPSHVGA